MPIRAEHPLRALLLVLVLLGTALSSPHLPALSSEENAAVHAALHEHGHGHEAPGDAHAFVSVHGLADHAHELPLLPAAMPAGTSPTGSACPRGVACAARDGPPYLPERPPRSPAPF